MGGLKTQDWKTVRNAGPENARLENAAPNLDWKTREKACMESQMVYFTCSIFVNVGLIHAARFEDALIQCNCFQGHGRVSHWERVIGVLDEDRKELIK